MELALITLNHPTLALELFWWTGPCRPFKLSREIYCRKRPPT